jgi:hypothetical protein
MQLYKKAYNHTHLIVNCSTVEAGGGGEGLGGGRGGGEGGGGGGGEGGLGRTLACRGVNQVRNIDVAIKSQQQSQVFDQVSSSQFCNPSDRVALQRCAALGAKGSRNKRIPKCTYRDRGQIDAILAAKSSARAAQSSHWVGGEDKGG